MAIKTMYIENKQTMMIRGGFNPFTKRVITLGINMAILKIMASVR